MPIHNISLPQKYPTIPDPLPSAIYVSSKNYFITLTAPYDSPPVILLTYDLLNTEHFTKGLNLDVVGLKYDTSLVSLME